jgi:hypothetical protein
VGGIEYIRLRTRNPADFATECGIAAGSLFAVGFATCLVFVLRGRLRSNSTQHTDACASSVPEHSGSTSRSARNYYPFRGSHLIGSLYMLKAKTVS